MPEITRRHFMSSALANAGCLLPSIAGAQELIASPLTDAAAARSPQRGMRLVWGGAAASIPGSSEYLEPDPNGNWVNKRTGERNRQGETAGAAGAGFVVADILAADRNGFLVWFTSLLIPLEGGGATRFIESNGAAPGAQNIADYWVAPAYLATLADRNDAGMRVLHMPYTLDGRTYRAVRIQSQTGNGWTQNTYDVDSGVLLFASTTVQGGPVRTLDPGNQIGTGAGNTLVTYTKFVAVRNTSLPGPGAIYPDSVGRLHSITYSGSRTYIMPGQQTQPFPFQLRYDVLSNAGSYLDVRASISGAPGSQDRVLPAGVIGSLWMSPESLARFNAGQTLDQDPSTGVQTVALGRQDNVALIALQTRLARQTFGYDLRSGLLVRGELRQQIGIVTDVLTYQLTASQ